MFAITIRDDQGELLIGVVAKEEDAPLLVQQREIRLFNEELSDRLSRDRPLAERMLKERLLKALIRCSVTRIG